MSITVSIVSHGHRAQVDALLAQLAQLQNADLRRVILTRNVPEPKSAAPDEVSPDRSGWPFELHRIDNSMAAGFGANHNRAFDEDTRLGASDHFAVVNPDVRLVGDPFPALTDALAHPDAGCAYPRQVDEHGQPQDHERTLPSPLALLERHLGTHRQPGSSSARPDWVNAAFLLFRHRTFAALGGFDTRYHMYCEDVDLCLRLQLRGHKLVCATQAIVVHVGQRASRHVGPHLGWHLASLWRLWNSEAYRDFKRLRATPH